MVDMLKMINCSISVLFFHCHCCKIHARVSRMRMQRIPCREEKSQKTFFDIDGRKLDTWDLW